MFYACSMRSGKICFLNERFNFLLSYRSETFIVERKYFILLVLFLSSYLKLYCRKYVLVRKLWCICCKFTTMSIIGSYIDEDSFEVPSDSLGVTDDIIMLLCQSLSDGNFYVYTDRFYTSFSLMMKLSEKKTFFTSW